MIEHTASLHKKQCFTGVPWFTLLKGVTKRVAKMFNPGNYLLYFFPSKKIYEVILTIHLNDRHLNGNKWLNKRIFGMFLCTLRLMIINQNLNRKVELIGKVGVGSFRNK